MSLLYTALLLRFTTLFKIIDSILAGFFFNAVEKSYA